MSEIDKKAEHILFTDSLVQISPTENVTLQTLMDAYNQLKDLAALKRRYFEAGRCRNGSNDPTDWKYVSVQDYEASEKEEK